MPIRVHSSGSGEQLLGTLRDCSGGSGREKTGEGAGSSHVWGWGGAGVVWGSSRVDPVQKAAPVAWVESVAIECVVTSLLLYPCML